jgi:DNA-binding NtrC family response regulator
MITDLSVSDMDGTELLKSVRKEHPAMKILVMPGLMGGPIMELAAELGASATFDKRLAPRYLLTAVYHMLDDWGDIRSI